MDTNDSEWEQELFDDHFTTVLNLFLERIKSDPSFTMEELQKYLDLAYQNQDDNWIGNGRVLAIKNNARVAALEMVMTEWKKVIEEERAAGKIPEGVQF
ncbi:hypothetical protein ENUP19_0054G0045 [Entamoeba nuttalli]|uniref:Uncharacterized protein n=2 Tax=Entamoeba nuttalli TaxID=412467 RepID=K2GW40_ENTNP|nr:hypothetical protein ENU1_129280 [Entamoeba nuttalli P19]EKE39413.1 hypothetical protein ENU1_129280 [Entamoeba nuttalli P19]|eukprot:XP_008858254.1 hypothetical protein ENU1_129280 [Entamoeba nuttalli P19]